MGILEKIVKWVRTNIILSSAIGAIPIIWKFCKMLNECVNNMEKMEIKPSGIYSTNDNGSLFSLYVDIFNEGNTDIDILDIKVELKDPDLYCFLEGDINQADDNNNVTVTTKARNFSNKYDFAKMPNLRPFRIALNSTKKHLKIFYTFLSTKIPLYNQYIDADLIIITKYSTNKHGFLTKILNKTSYKNRSHFKFEKEKEEIVRHGGFEIPLIGAKKQN